MPETLLEVTQADREAAAAFYGPHLARPGEVPVTAYMRAGKIDESPLIQAFARHRLDALASLQPSVSEMSNEGREVCNRCHKPHCCWFAPSPLWNAVMRGGSIDGPWEFSEMICAGCFMALAEERGIARDFRVDAKVVNVELETVTPSGRIWDATKDQWVSPPALSPEGEP